MKIKFSLVSLHLPAEGLPGGCVSFCPGVSNHRIRAVVEHKPPDKMARPFIFHRGVLGNLNHWLTCMEAELNDVLQIIPEALHVNVQQIPCLVIKQAREHYETSWNSARKNTKGLFYVQRALMFVQNTLCLRRRPGARLFWPSPKQISLSRRIPSLIPLMTDNVATERKNWGQWSRNKGIGKQLWAKRIHAAKWSLVQLSLKVLTPFEKFYLWKKKFGRLKKNWDMHVWQVVLFRCHFSSDFFWPAVMIQMMMTWLRVVTAMFELSRWTPSLSWRAPKPRLVHTPNMVATTDTMSTKSPIQP